MINVLDFVMNGFILMPGISPYEILNKYKHINYTPLLGNAKHYCQNEYFHAFKDSACSIALVHALTDV